MVEWFPLASPVGTNELVVVPEGKVTFGKPVDFPSYGWDNEYGQVTMKWVQLTLSWVCVCTSLAYNNSVPKFEASQYLITNGEFLEFVNAGGYEKEEFWTAEG